MNDQNDKALKEQLQKVAFEAQLDLLFDARVAELRDHALVQPGTVPPDSSSAVGRDFAPRYASRLVSAIQNTHGLSKTAIASKLGVSSLTLRNYTTGDRNMPYTSQYALESLLASDPASFTKPDPTKDHSK